jgi:hypothetical protein
MRPVGTGMPGGGEDMNSGVPLDALHASATAGSATRGGRATGRGSGAMAPGRTWRAGSLNGFRRADITFRSAGAQIATEPLEVASGVAYCRVRQSHTMIGDRTL